MANDTENPSHNTFTTETFPPLRRATLGLLEASSRKHMIHGLIEVDVTYTRLKLREIRREQGREVSLSSFVLYCVAKSVQADKRMHAYRDGRNRLFLFDEVDISTPVEHHVEGRDVIVPTILRAANLKTPYEIHNEIEIARNQPVENAGVFPAMRFYLMLPTFIKMAFFKYMDRHPKQMKRIGGTVMVSCLNMFGSGTGWGLPVASHTLNLTLGGIAVKPVLVREKLENHEFLCVTVSVDHDLVDGAPLARFIHRFKKMLEKAEELTIHSNP